MAIATDLRIEPMTSDDWPAVREIYEAGMSTGDATLDTEPPDHATWDRSHLATGRLVARDRDDRVVGWIALAPVSDRCVYDGVAWESVYVAADARGQGIGRGLLEAAIAASEAADIWTLQAGVLAENAASLALHEGCGFRRVGVREALGRDGSGRWRDVVLLERRSRVVGR
ncbi:MAG TPA: GNAT family N-acetyltransferase [Candidatus Limnocylindrales bacterium]|jgi:phosphinothricin acetyltransferase